MRASQVTVIYIVMAIASAMGVILTLKSSNSTNLLFQTSLSVPALLELPCIALLALFRRV